LLSTILARLPRSADPGTILIALVAMAIVIVIVLATTSRKIKRLGADLAKSGFVPSAPARNTWTTRGTYDPVLRGSWKGKSASVTYSGRRNRRVFSFQKMPPRYFTRIEVDGRTSELPGWADAVVVAMELDALASYTGETTATRGP
jgi:hypothetical protein